MDVLVIVMPYSSNEESDYEYTPNTDPPQLRSIKMKHHFTFKELLLKLNIDDTTPDNDKYQSVFMFQNGAFVQVKNLEQKNNHTYPTTPLYLVSKVEITRDNFYGGKHIRKLTRTKKSKRNKNKKTR
jgi:hypothetical protein